MGEGDVDADHWHQSFISLLFMVFNVLAIFQDLSNSLDSRRIFEELVSETTHIGDLEEEEGFCLLWKAAQNVALDVVKIQSRGEGDGLLGHVGNLEQV